MTKTNKLFEKLNTEYDNLVDGIMTDIEEHGLPFYMEVDPEKQNLIIMTVFLKSFREDTGLDASFEFYTNDDDDDLHCTLHVYN